MRSRMSVRARALDQCDVALDRVLIVSDEARHSSQCCEERSLRRQNICAFLHLDVKRNDGEGFDSTMPTTEVAGKYRKIEQARVCQLDVQDVSAFLVQLVAIFVDKAIRAEIPFANPSAIITEGSVPLRTTILELNSSLMFKSTRIRFQMSCGERR